jgi:hypothetical protein
MVSILGNTVLSVPTANVPDFTLFQIDFYDPQYPSVTTAGSVRPRWNTPGSGLEYSLDGGNNWTTIASRNTIQVPAGSYLLMRGSGRTALFTADGTGNNWELTPSNTSHKARTSGNINTLLDYINPPVTIGYYAFAGMFANCAYLTQAPALTARILGNYAYSYMFSGCSSLIQAPAIVATSVGSYSCQYMFQNCTSMVTSPGRLNTITLEPYCYRDMFNRCTAMTTAPVIAALVMEQFCCQYMFSYCSSLTVAPELPATSLAINCYEYMFDYCSGLTTPPPVLPATVPAREAYSYMFSHCDNLENTPEIMLESLTTYVCWGMFEHSKKVNKLKVHITQWNGSATDYWLNDVSATGAFTCPAALPNNMGTGRIPSNWTRVDF